VDKKKPDSTTGRGRESIKDDKSTRASTCDSLKHLREDHPNGLRKIRHHKKKNLTA